MNSLSNRQHVTQNYSFLSHYIVFTILMFVLLVIAIVNTHTHTGSRVTIMTSFLSARTIVGGHRHYGLCVCVKSMRKQYGIHRLHRTKQGT